MLHQSSSWDSFISFYVDMNDRRWPPGSLISWWSSLNFSWLCILPIKLIREAQFDISHFIPRLGRFEPKFYTHSTVRITRARTQHIKISFFIKIRKNIQTHKHNHTLKGKLILTTDRIERCLGFGLITRKINRVANGRGFRWALLFAKNTMLPIIGQWSHQASKSWFERQSWCSSHQF